MSEGQGVQLQCLSKLKMAGIKNYRIKETEWFCSTDVVLHFCGDICMHRMRGHVEDRDHYLSCVFQTKRVAINFTLVSSCAGCVLLTPEGTTRV